MINPFTYEPKGDKHNSDYFNEYRLKIYERRKTSGLEDLFGDMCSVVVQVQTGDALAYLKELYLMTPYRYQASYINDTHKIYCLINKKNTPIYIVLEPLDPNFKDDVTRINKMYPNAREKFNARYIGEIFKTKNLKETKKILMSQEFQFHDPDLTENKFYCNHHFQFTRLSDLTFNCIGYSEDDVWDFDKLDLGQRFTLTKAQETELNKANQFTEESDLRPLIKGIDHMATRILAGEREDAILEFLCLSNYYFWGAYNINDMNSSTNVNRAKHGDDIRSPAKVFTANNTPYMINSFKNLPMPTENFVRNYGRRMHHIAMEVLDGDHPNGGKNIDYVINTLKKNAHIDFLAKVFGTCGDAPDLQQIFSKHSPLSLLITEYVERCHGFDGFFTKDNVAALTEAAGLDETVKAHHKKHGLIGD
ncbi:hypothetical protein [Legionella nagasakiensis]|uniref:hypothetical protein n=1 Tax=Legionella nagasakiensis TaxID=535290 RepID=UPI001054B28B|nr:hypothetical protein [Legionella nagasakiensis]